MVIGDHDRFTLILPASAGARVSRVLSIIQTKAFHNRGKVF
jgi:hypothetical protein